MRRLSIVLCTLLAVMLPATAAPAATSSFHFKSRGPGAEAFWSTFPFDAEPVPNQEYTDTFLFTSQEAVRADGTRFEDRFLFIDRFTYKFDRRGNFIFVSETFGFASGDDVALSVDPKLNSASVEAIVALETCDENFTCMDAGTAVVAASWTGVGDVAKVSERFTFKTKTFMEKFTFRGRFRDATATGQFAGEDLGESLFADIFNATSSELFICHNC
jgi:hypothetical protein